MTRAEATERRAYLKAKIAELEDQLLTADANSASVSAGGGSRSYTNRSVEEIKHKLAYARGQLAAVEHALGLRGDNPNAPRRVEVRFS